MSSEVYIAVFASLAAFAAGVGFVAFDKRRSAAVLTKWAAESNF
jgi:hypothetical protein